MVGPAKFELKEFLNFAKLLDFLKQDYRPFTAISREAVRRGIIKQSEVNHFYHIFTTCIEVVMDLFDNMYFPEDQTPTGKARYEWKLKDGVTEKVFIERINKYVAQNFKTPL